MEKWQHASASQIKTFRRCERKWWFEKIEGHRSPTTPAAELARAIHAELEAYLLGGDEPASPIARAGLKYLPRPEEGLTLLVEEEFSYSEGLPVPVIGFIDLVEPGSRRVTDTRRRVISGGRRTSTSYSPTPRQSSTAR